MIAGVEPDDILCPIASPVPCLADRIATWVTDLPRRQPVSLNQFEDVFRFREIASIAVPVIEGVPQLGNRAVIEYRRPKAEFRLT